VHCDRLDFQEGCPHFADGALYDLAGDRWTPINGEGAPSARHEHLLAWTGRELLIWGGRGGAVTPTEPFGSFLVDGALYDPGKRTWRAVAPAPVPARPFINPVWTGTRLVVVADDLASWSYDPASNRWGPRLPPPADSCGGATLQAGALVARCSEGQRNFAALLAPGANQWTTIDLPELAGDQLLWTGKRLFAWGRTEQGGCGNRVESPSNCLPPSPTVLRKAWMQVP
jgi:hypothetical protein